ncbi:hypothetical protein [Methylophilus sp.]|uniref:hypothetical protein n=1 Tax=Methylophilus sp. TaxID=29541 RepID=UPI004036306B
MKNTDNLDCRFAYPPDDGLPTSEQLAAIARIVPQDIELITVSSLFDDIQKQQHGENL